MNESSHPNPNHALRMPPFKIKSSLCAQTMMSLTAISSRRLLLLRRRQLPAAVRKKGTAVVLASSPSWKAHAPSPRRCRYLPTSNSKTTPVAATFSTCWRGHPAPAPRTTTTVIAPRSSVVLVVLLHVRLAPSVGTAAQATPVAIAFNDEQRL